MFAGIGGFRAGLDRAGGFKCVGHCEIDKYADASYRAIHDIGKDECYFPDARTIKPENLPEFDMLCGGFPCQPFSSSGLHRGFDDVRGTLFFEITRLAEARKPSYLFLENVPHLLGHDKGRTYGKILAALSELGYHVEWCVLNSADFGPPQSRRRLFIIAYIDARCRGKIFPVFGTAGKALVQIVKGPQGSRIYDTEGVACTQTAQAGGMGGKTGLYLMGLNHNDSVTVELCDINYNQTPNALFVDLCAGHPTITEKARCVTADYGKARMSNHKGEMSGVLLIKEGTKLGYKEAAPGDTVNLSFAGNDLNRGRVGKDIAHTLDTTNKQGVVVRGGRVRRLMPRECLRLQGFAEDQIDRLLAITSDSQAYKQAGNSVTVNVIEAIGRRIRAVDEELKAADSS